MAGRLAADDIDPSSECPGATLRYAVSMDRSALYIWLWLIWMTFLVVGFTYVLFSAGRPGCKGHQELT